MLSELVRESSAEATKLRLGGQARRSGTCVSGQRTVHGVPWHSPSSPAELPRREHLSTVEVAAEAERVNAEQQQSEFLGELISLLSTLFYGGS